MLIPIILSLLIQASPVSQAEDKAIAYLVREVPKWSAENHCFSCHNNGDGARALYTARRMRRAVPDAALSDTTAWLSRPAEWGKDHGAPGFANRALGVVQFASALIDARDAGSSNDTGAIEAAALELISHQEPDGSWKIDDLAAAASPATYGPVIATYMARRVLSRSGSPQALQAHDRAHAG